MLRIFTQHEVTLETQNKNVEYDKSSKYKIQLQQNLIAKTCIMYFEYHDTKGFGFKVSADSLKATS